MKSVDIRGAATYGVYQSNAQTKNYFAGGTGIGPGTESPSAVLHVGGDVRVDGRLLVLDDAPPELPSDRAIDGSNTKAMRNHRAVVLTTQSNAVMSSGNADLDGSGSATVLLAARVTSETTMMYTLTAVGAPMPMLHVATQWADGAFSIGGGAPHGRVSWSVTVAS